VVAAISAFGTLAHPNSRLSVKTTAKKQEIRFMIYFLSECGIHYLSYHGCQEMRKELLERKQKRRLPQQSPHGMYAN
jgi:hypothetical protein